MEYLIVIKLGKLKENFEICNFRGPVQTRKMKNYLFMKFYMIFEDILKHFWRNFEEVL